MSWPAPKLIWMWTCACKHSNTPCTLCSSLSFANIDALRILRSWPTSKLINRSRPLPNRLGGTRQCRRPLYVLNLRACSKVGIFTDYWQSRYFRRSFLTASPFSPPSFSAYSASMVRSKRRRFNATDAASHAQEQQQPPPFGGQPRLSQANGHTAELPLHTNGQPPHERPDPRTVNWRQPQNNVATSKSHATPSYRSPRRSSRPPPHQRKNSFKRPMVDDPAESRPSRRPRTSDGQAVMDENEIINTMPMPTASEYPTLDGRIFEYDKIIQELNNRAPKWGMSIHASFGHAGRNLMSCILTGTLFDGRRKQVEACGRDRVSNVQ